MRFPSPQSAVQKWKVKGQVEKVLWNHFQPDLLLVSKQGGVRCEVGVVGVVGWEVGGGSGGV